MKGQTYSIIAIIIAIPVIIFITQYYVQTQNTKSHISENIVADQLHELEYNIESDFYRALDIGVKRSLLSSVNHVILEGQSLDNSTVRLKELMENGTLYGNETFLMKNNTLNTWVERMLRISTGFSKQVNYSDLAVTNIRGLVINAAANLNVTVSSRYGAMKIEKRNLRGTVNVSAEGLDDPVFPLNTEGFVRRIIRMYPLSYTVKKLVNGTLSNGHCTGNVSFNKSNPDENKILVTDDASGVSGFKGVVAESSNLPSVSCYVVGALNAINIINNSIQETGYNEIYIDNRTSSPLSVWHLPMNLALENKYYFYGDGPNYFKRLEGNLSSSSDGIESFVNIPELESNGLTVKPYSRVDYLYFSDNNTISHNVRGFPEWFTIDDYHANKYNLTELII